MTTFTRQPIFREIQILKCSIRKRKRSSHGLRKTHNVNRRCKRTTSLRETLNFYRRSGIHSMLRIVTNLPLSSLRRLNEEAEHMILQTIHFRLCRPLFKKKYIANMRFES